MRRVLATAAAVLALLTMMPVVSAGATTPAGVEIVVPGFEGPFTASGAAVDAGVVCGSGEVVTTYRSFTGFQSGFAVNIAVGKEFTCDDGSGTFSAKLQVRALFEGGVSFRWAITGGTGDYEDLHGAGSGFVVPVDTDIYQGALHTD